MQPKMIASVTVHVCQYKTRAYGNANHDRNRGDKFPSNGCRVLHDDENVPIITYENVRMVTEPHS